MKSGELNKLTALELASAIKAKKISVPEAVSAYMDNIEKNDKQFNAFLTVASEKALECAVEVQAKIDKGEVLSPLAGVPVSLKDNISTEGIETTCASKMLKGYKPVYNAAVVEKLERAGMIIIGKNNMDEFALGCSGETEAFGAIRNPWDVTRSAGDGSAAAVIAGETPLALGTDTGGYIRQPCAFCGITGINPTYGSVSRYGIIANVSSMDQAGPVGQNIEDCAALLSIISGSDERDSTCLIKEPFEFDLTAGVPADSMKGVRIGVPANVTSGAITPLDDDIKNAVFAAVKEYEAAGASIEEFEMPLMDYVIPAYCIIGSAELSSNLAKFDGLKFGYRSGDAKTLSDVYKLSRTEGFGMEVKRRIMLGSFVLSAEQYEIYFKKAQQVRILIRDAYKKLFERFDFILSPVTAAAAHKPGEYIDDPMKTYMGDIFTASVNLAGLPAAALPCGFNKQGMPVGFQLIGNTFSENKLINAGRVFQSRTNFHTIKPGKKS
ncbi:MAG: Asp-tRNA(Asn)/Glu-tRNA(Gln) amidotransferase subunit GatA [Treponema sp.]|nr:Asp-tRNA(Asn)/Glu-tRNA(Gln) amidotransferase subunit GatA [Treponema sp.]